MRAFRVECQLGITAYLALVLWPLGEVARAREVAEEMVVRAANAPKLGHTALPAAVAASHALARD